MKSVIYGSETFLTSNAVADALLTYAATLRGMDHGVLVTVPTVNEHGEPASLSLVLAPGIPILSRPSVAEIPDPDAVDLLEQIATMTRKRTTASLLVPGQTGPDTSVHLDTDTTTVQDGEH